MRLTGEHGRKWVCYLPHDGDALEHLRPGFRERHQHLYAAFQDKVHLEAQLEERRRREGADHTRTREVGGEELTKRSGGF
jgi:hypothetical protein